MVRARNAHVATLRTQAEICDAFLEVNSTAETAGVHFSSAPDAQPVVHLCDVCGVSCRSLRVLIAHKYKKHGVRNPYRSLVTGYGLPGLLLPVFY